jgi:hypothetical protein
MPLRSRRQITGGPEAGTAAAAPALAAPSAEHKPDATRVDGAKARLARLFSHEVELGVELSELDAEHAIKLSELEAAHMAAVECVTATREAVRADIKAAQSELDAAVNAPVSGGRDPTESLPDELMVMIMMMLPFATLLSGGCERVCQRWKQLMESARIVRLKREGRWAAYEEGVIEPQKLKGHTGNVLELPVGSNGRVYSASQDSTVRVWSGESGAHLQTLQGHTKPVIALAIGLDGKIYSGSADKTIRVWSSASGTLAQYLDSPLVSTAKSTRGRPTALSVCGLETTAPTCRRSWGTRMLSTNSLSAKTTTLFIRVQKTTPSGCGLAKMEPTSAHSWDTHAASLHSQ